MIETILLFIDNSEESVTTSNITDIPTHSTITNKDQINISMIVITIQDCIRICHTITSTIQESIIPHIIDILESQTI